MQFVSIAKPVYCKVCVLIDQSTIHPHVTSRETAEGLLVNMLGAYKEPQQSVDTFSKLQLEHWLQSKSCITPIEPSAWG